MATPVPGGARVERGVETQGTGSRGSRQAAPGDIAIPGVARDPGLSVNPNQFGAQVGQAMAGLGNEIGRLADVRAGFEQRRKNVENSIFLARARSTLNQRMYSETLEAQQAAETGDNFLQTVTPRYDKARMETLEGLTQQYNPDPETLQRYEAIAAGLQEDYSIKAITFENNERVAAYGRALDEEINSLAEGVLRHGNVEDALASFDETVEGFQESYTPSQYAEIRENGRRRIALAYAEGRVRDNPASVRRAFGGASTNSLVGAVISVESNGNPEARSSAGAVGLMQVMPGTAREIAQDIGDRNFPFGGSPKEVAAYMEDPDINVRYGTHYLKKMMRRYGGDVEAALVAYNGGPGRADKWIESRRDDSVLPKETREYYKKVLAKAEGGGDTPLDEAAKYLTFEDQLKFLDRAERAGAVEADKFQKDFDNHVASIESYGVGLQGFDVNRATDFMAPERVELLRQREEQAHSDFNSYQAIKYGGIAEAQSAVAEAAPIPGTDNIVGQQQRFQNFRKAYQDRIDQTVSAAGSDSFDPAQYVQTGFQDVASAYGDALQTMDSGAVDTAIRTSLQAQREVGVPTVDLRALPNEIASNLATELMRTPADQRYIRMIQMQEQFGDHWDQVFSEMVDAGLDPSTELLGLVSDNPVDAELVAKVIGVDTKDLESNIGSEISVKQDLFQPIEDELAPFMRAFEAGSFDEGNLFKTNRVVEAVKKVAMQHYREHRNVDEAINRSTSMITGRFQVIDNGNANLVAPTDVDEGDIEDALAVKQGEEAIRDFDPMPIGDPSAPDFLDEPRILSTAVNSGIWMTTERGNGAMLMIPFRGGGWVPLMNKRGERYEVRWGDVEDIASDAPPGLVGRFGEFIGRQLGVVPPDGEAQTEPRSTRDGPGQRMGEQRILDLTRQSVEAGQITESQARERLRSFGYDPDKL